MRRGLVRRGSLRQGGDGAADRQREYEQRSHGPDYNRAIVPLMAPGDGTQRRTAPSNGGGSASMKIARRFLVTGLVQGVGFRWYTKDAARREGVTGYVRNLADGSVEAFAEGDIDAVTRLERAIRRGPAGGRAMSGDASDRTPGGGSKTFA